MFNHKQFSLPTNMLALPQFLIFLLVAAFQAQAQISELEEICDVAPESCLRLPSDCKANSSNTCQAVASITSLGNATYRFSIATSPGNNYVALGFSEDKRMGDDVVVDCLNLALGPAIHPGRNEALFKHVQLKEESLQIKTVKKGQSAEDGLYCIFEIENELTVENSTISLNETYYYLLLAMGNVNAEGDMARHSKRTSSDEPFQFSDKPSAAPTTIVSFTLLLTAFASFIIKNLALHPKW